MVNPVEFTRDLIRCPSVTPADAGALDVLEQKLTALGFTCTRLPFSEPGTPDVDNLYARLGTDAPNFCFAGHTDVVPVGAAADWSVDPFAGEVNDGWLTGRGAADMKGAIAAFVAAVSRLLDDGEVKGSISFLITGDEEGPAINGTIKMLQWLEDNGEKLDYCLVGEPTNPTTLGEMAKIGRRGSLNTRLVVKGTQGHVAYPHLADNPIPRLIEILHRLTGKKLDDGNDHFQPSNLEVVTIDVGNEASNVIPAEAEARFNIRFNNEQSIDGLKDWIRSVCDAVGGEVELEMKASGDAFLTPPGVLSDLITGAVEKVTGIRPELSTTGGTSDARFIKDYCPVSEFGLVSQTMHKVDERVRVEDIEQLADIYTEILNRFFRNQG
ncbi:succinyl-diaminopimelate desuccinylase [Emcibacter nanhaiensis]|uniref:Succinyl-diaminopimelate desuccinylase n=1 Tax=Emcibacter nanhaiensis TaxID=1505037 RepID=A0A501PCN0_9PROT|nr:succinyl-diaminopimelate desuccinylase [Emcibacter nanhaiensis]